MQPFTQQTRPQQRPEILTVEDQSETIVTVRTDREIKRGQVFRFQPAGIGIALEDGQTVPVRLRSRPDATLTAVERGDVVPFSNIPRPLTAVSPETLGQLQVEVALRDSVPAGALGWTLTYQSLDPDRFDESPLVQYHDYYNRGQCLLNGPDKWDEGIYTLYITLYDRRRMAPIRLKTRDWTLQQPQQKLGCGNNCPLPAVSFL